MTRRSIGLLLVLLLPAALLMAAGHGEPHAEEAAGHHTNVDFWKTVNFVILAAGLGWLVRKFAGTYFAGRTAEIQRGIAEAGRIREEAEARAAAIDGKLANLEAEIAELRESARREMAAEEERLKDQADRTLARMRSAAGQEIESASKQARQELRSYAAELALKLARRKIRDRMSPRVAAGLVDGFVTGLDRVERKVK